MGTSKGWNVQSVSHSKDISQRVAPRCGHDAVSVAVTHRQQLVHAQTLEGRSAERFNRVVDYSGKRRPHCQAAGEFHRYCVNWANIAHRVTVRLTAVQNGRRQCYRWGHDKVLSEVGSFTRAFRRRLVSAASCNECS